MSADLKFHPQAEMFPNLEGQEWKDFVDGIAKTGGNATNPILYRIVHGKPQGLDGRQRLRACRALKLKPTLKKVSVKDEDVVDFILAQNDHRRHSTTEFRKSVAVEMRKAGESIRSIADKLNVDPGTVRNDLKKSQVGSDSPPDTVKGKDGKLYPKAGDEVLCARCKRTGAVKDCAKCRWARSKAEKRKAGGGTKPKSGKVSMDWKMLTDAKAVMVKFVDKVGKPFKKENSPEAEKLREEVVALHDRIKGWFAALFNTAAGSV